MNGIGFLLFAVAVVALALLAAYLHARCRGWDPKNPDA